MTTRRRRRFTAAFKKRVVLEALRGDRTVQEIAARHEVEHIHRHRHQCRGHDPSCRFLSDGCTTGCSGRDGQQELDVGPPAERAAEGDVASMMTNNPPRNRQP